MIHLFKSHFSIGKSILKIDRIFELAGDQAVMVEDSMSGFRKAMKAAKKAEKQLIFGYRTETAFANNPHKMVFFAKNGSGISSLRKIATKSQLNEGVYKYCEDDIQDIEIAIPFYDSFVAKSFFEFGVFDMPLKDVVFFEESNDHPFDRIISSSLGEMGVETIRAQSVFYEKPEDFKAFQFYKACCNRSGGKSPKFQNPDIAHCCSDQFCLTKG
jgi:hypothetical protein